jgi:hypothetical protein
VLFSWGGWRIAMLHPWHGASGSTLLHTRHRAHARHTTGGSAVLHARHPALLFHHVLHVLLHHMGIAAHGRRGSRFSGFFGMRRRQAERGYSLL